MSFSSIAVEQRSKEAQALRLFLGCSLAGSLALHIAVLATGLGNFLARVPVEEDPIEVTIVDAPEPEKIPIQPIQEQERSPSQPLNNTVVPIKNDVAFVPQPQPKLKSPIIPQKQFAAAAEKPVTTSQPAARRNPVTTSPSTTQTSTNSASSSPSQATSKVTTPGGGGSSGFSGSTGILTGSGTGIGVGSGTGSGTGIGNGNGSGIGSGTGTGSGSGTGAGIGNGSGTGTGNGNGSGTGNGNGTGTGNSNPVAVAPQPRKIEAPTNRGNSNGRAACSQCDSKYPEQARRRGIEGKVEVAVDTDANGNVTNVRLTRSSGNRDLDEAHLRQAREWKLKPNEGGRQGVAISTDYAIRGSRRYREAQERKRQRQAREAEQQQQTATANQNSTNESPRRRRSLTSGTIVDVTPEVRNRRVPAASENSAPRQRLRQPVNSNVSPSRPTTSSGENNAPTVQRRRRRPDSATTSDSANRLRNALRRSRPQTESAPAAPVSEPNKSE
ncbi:energy transducer TonB [Nostoc sp. FACHB-110]|uniref:energy transducer TonB n=1 Tax=Nostoc sp. FACHB-110 TaxID=2692834 RepID=UPI001683FEEF|nr:energy transducer TonB [Nostoc sp. FACHB-110]MBD2436112.1 energy transducer TonB [Nostoc sp. FACHB-110]